MNLGGGIAIWVREDLNFDIIKTRSLDRTCEMQAISLPDLKLCIINVYRPPGDFNNSIDILEQNLEQINKEFPSNTILMVGDFNIDLTKSSTACNNLIDLTLGFEMLQLVTLPTRVNENYQL